MSNYVGWRMNGWLEMEQMSALHERLDRELHTGSTVAAILESQAAWTEIQKGSQDFISRNKLQTFLPRS